MQLARSSTITFTRSSPTEINATAVELSGAKA